ncbi:MAG: hypothetical protein RI947_1097 [Candidatus Parcubacteria bacterium]|jgi:DNA processing protein
MMDPLLADLGFSHCLGIGPMTYSLLIDRFATAEKAYNASTEDLRAVIGEALTREFLKFRAVFHPHKKLQEYKSKDVLVLSRRSILYPHTLLTLQDAPICLYVKGDISQFSLNEARLLGVVGTRKPTSYGVQVTKMLVEQLVAEGWVIVSGLAIGIDATAHRTALDNGGKTIAFLGCGVNIMYPYENADLYRRMKELNGLIISEFPPDMTVKRGMFISRNRLISGLSRGVLVIEGSGTSGALATARYAAVQGRDVFATPAPITSAQSQAPNILLKEGAIVVTCGNDILDAYNLTQARSTGEVSHSFTDKQEQDIYRLLQQECLRSDDIAHKLEVSIATVLQTLSELEMKGVVRQNIAGEYELC